MSKTTETATGAVAATRAAVNSAAYNGFLIVSASLFVALCARVTLPLPFTPVPLTLQNFGVLLVGIALGGWRGAAALALYVAEGASGLPVFNPAGPGGIAQLLGPTGGFLMAYPAVAFIVGYISRCFERRFLPTLIGATLGEVVLFAGGISWLMITVHASAAQAAQMAAVPFIFAEVIKILGAAAIAPRLPKRFF
jgi:biotin transport system substrate-specific component